MSADSHAEIETLRACCPGLPIETAVEDASGQFNRVIRVNDEWIFRFPRYPEGIDQLESETRLLQHLNKLSPGLPLPIPDPVYTCFEPRLPGRVFVGYRRLPGEPFYRSRLAEIQDEIRLDFLAGQLADFLRALHTVPLHTVPLHTVPLHAAPLHTVPTGDLDLPPADRLEQWTDMYERVQRDLFLAMRPDARAAIAAHFEPYLADRTLNDFLPALRHGDFGGSNILYNPAAGMITGVIDFSFCAPGDPAVDLAAVSTLGADFYTRILAKYAPDDVIRARLDARARFYRGTFALQEALAGLDTGDEEAYRSGMENFI